MTAFQSIVVPATPPKPPQLTLVGSAAKPSVGADPSGSVYELTADQIAALPADLRAELASRQGDSWVRGFTYQPESHAEAQVTGACVTGSDTLGAPPWNKLSTFAIGKVVEFRGRLFESIKAANKNKNPLKETTFWKDVTVTLNRPTNLEPVVFVPYVIVAIDLCTTFGFEEHDFKGRAARLLDNATPKAVGKEFWTGATAQAEGWPNAYLASEAAEDLTPAGGATAVRGLQILQDAIAHCGFGGQAMIHCEPEAAPNLLSARRVGAMYYDIFDNLVVPDPGYTGSGPKPETAKETEERETKRETWMYATDLVYYQGSQPEIFPETFAEATDWGEGSAPNTIAFAAERFGAAWFDGACHFAVKVTLPA